MAHRETEQVCKEEPFDPEEVVIVEAEQDWDDLWATQASTSPTFWNDKYTLEGTITDLKWNTRNISKDDDKEMKDDEKVSWKDCLAPQRLCDMLHRVGEEGRER